MPLDSRRFEIEPAWEDYRIALTRGWAKHLYSIMPRGNRLRPIAFDLVGDLRYISMTASLPSQLAMQLSAFAGGFAREDVTPSIAKTVADAIATRLAGRLAACGKLTESAMTEIRGECMMIRQEVAAAASKTPVVTTEAVWRDYLENKGFQFGVWGIQRICFAAAFNAYDNFLTRCVSVALGRPNFRRKSPEKFEAALDHFGTDAAKILWLDNAVEVPRMIRHSLSHCGGRETDELRQVNHGLPVHDGYIQITASHNAKLLRVIESRVLLIAGAAKTMPQFAPKPKVK
jgi:hypothetical protein